MLSLWLTLLNERKFGVEGHVRLVQFETFLIMINVNARFSNANLIILPIIKF